MGYDQRVSPNLSVRHGETQFALNNEKFLIHNQPQVRVCLPVPMYHCFGSVIAAMCMAVHGITLVFPSSGYNSLANLEAIQKEKYIPQTPYDFQ